MSTLMTPQTMAGNEHEMPEDAEAPQPRSAGDYRIERFTWFGVVGVLVITDALPDWLSLHQGLTPLAAGLVFILSGVVRKRRGWSMPLFIWVAGTLLLVMAGFNFLSQPALDLSLVVVVFATIVITMGVFRRDR